jgi:hypothetical protein
MDEREKQQQRFEQKVQEKQSEARARAEEESIAAHERPQDEGSVRAKASGHRKKTADKWNQ